MDSKDYRNLQEAYQDVYSIDEGIRSSLKRFLGRKTKEAEAPKPMSRGEVLRQRYNVGPEGSYTSAKRQILNRSRARAERDEDKYGGSIYTKKVADKSREAHNRYLKAGYSKYGADLKHGKGNKAARRAATLNREEYDYVLSHLLDEGYTNTLNGAEVIASNMSEEWIENIIEAKYGTKAGRKKLAKKIRKGENIGKKGPGTGFKAVEKAAKAGGAKDPAAVAAAAMWKTYGK